MHQIIPKKLKHFFSFRWTNRINMVTNQQIEWWEKLQSVVQPRLHNWTYDSQLERESRFSPEWYWHVHISQACRILIKFNETQCANLEARTSIILTDYSRFGTFLNEARIKEFQTLNPNDVIHFGSLMVITYCVTAANKSQLKKQLCRLGGYLVNDWHNECSFVVMDKLQ